MNEVKHGDCFDILQTYPDDTFHLVYLDPPFFTQKSHQLKNRSRSQTYTFDDTWENLDAYLDFLRQRLFQIKRVMHPTATLFFHCDKTASHHIRLLLDQVFQPDRFLSEIIWTYKRWSNAQQNLMNAHQTIFMYSKSETYTFNTLYQDYSLTTNLDQILQKRERDEDNKAIYARDDQGEVIFNGAKKGVPLSDTWAIPFLNPKAKERTGYPTQKPLLLLERIIKLGSHPDDVVLDPFCGSGTTLVAAAHLDRQYVGIDLSQAAVELSLSRLKNPIKSESHLMNKGREAYDNLPDYVKAILSPLPVKLVQRNAGIDALHDDFIDNQPIVIRVQRHDETLIEAAEKLHHAGQRKRACRMILIQIEPDIQQLSLFDQALPDNITVIPSVNLALKQLIRI